MNVGCYTARGSERKCEVGCGVRDEGGEDGAADEDGTDVIR